MRTENFRGSPGGAASKKSKLFKFIPSAKETAATVSSPAERFKLPSKNSHLCCKTIQSDCGQLSIFPAQIVNQDSQQKSSNCFGRLKRVWNDKNIVCYREQLAGRDIAILAGVVNFLPHPNPPLTKGRE